MYVASTKEALAAARGALLALQAEMQAASDDAPDAPEPFELCQHASHIAVMTVKNGEPADWVIWPMMTSMNETVFHIEGPQMVTRNGLPTVAALVNMIKALL